MAHKPPRTKVHYERVARFEKIVNGRTEKETRFYYNGKIILSEIPIDNMTNYLLYYLMYMKRNLEREVTTLNGVHLIISLLEKDTPMYRGSIINIYLLSEAAFSEEIIRKLLSSEEIKIYKKSYVLEIDKPQYFNGADRLVQKILGGEKY